MPETRQTDRSDRLARAASESTSQSTSQSTSESTHVLGHDETTPMHAHDEGHLVYPATGVLSVTTEAGSWIAPPNRAVWTPAGSAHQHRAHGTTAMRIAFITGALADALPTHPAVLAVSPLARELMLALTGSAGSALIREPPAGTTTPLGPTTPPADRTGVHRRTPEQRDRLRQVLVDELTTAREQPLHLPTPHDPRLLAVTAIVANDLADPATLAELGRRVGASERTLSRLFHRETGMSFRQWRTQLRIHRALLLLADGVSVIDTATACGWANPSVFIQAFTTLVGATPGSYQRSLRAGDSAANP